MKLTYLNTASIATLLLFAGAANAETFNIPSGDLKSALDNYARQTGVNLIVAGAEVTGVQTKGAQGDFSADSALSHLLSGTGFSMHRRSSGAIGIMRDERSSTLEPVSETSILLAQASATPRTTVETVTVTSSKLGGADVQSIPISITALSQEQLTTTQTSGGPDLVKQVPNLTFSKTNFTGYNIQIRGVGTQAVSVTTDPAVAVAFNDVPFIRNHFFEQEFYDVGQVEVLRGPQGTLFGRNATAGVVNVISSKPADRYEARGSLDVGNYNNRRLEGMLNIPVVEDKLDLRVAGEWTKRDGYAHNDITDSQIDGRDLYSTRISLLIRPFEKLTATAIWEHFQESDNRARSTKQLCARDNGPAVVDGPQGPIVPTYTSIYGVPGNNFGAAWLSQGCRAASLYSPDSYQTPNIAASPFLSGFVVFTIGEAYLSPEHYTDPYSGAAQSPDLRTISSQIDPVYRAKNDTFEFNADYELTSSLTLTSQTAYGKDFLYSTEDFNRFDTAPNFLKDAGTHTFVGQDNEFCDPQVGCSSRFVAEDRSSESARQFYQELRLTSDFKGPLNFTVGGNYLSYRTSEDYYVFSNLTTLFALAEANAGFGGGQTPGDASHIPFDASIANSCNPQPASTALIDGTYLGLGCSYIDLNPIDKVTGEGHNYFLNHNPYQLKSWAGFGEIHYHVAPAVELTAGLRYTEDEKIFEVYPSWALEVGKGIPNFCVVPNPECRSGIIDQKWGEWTGRSVVNWTPKIDFTDQTMIYASFAHGYKGGGANPPGVTPIYSNGLLASSLSSLTHPLTFKPEFNNALELGTKNTLADGSVTLNGDVFLYKYRNYQISQIVDRTAINLNLNATVTGAELTTEWEPLPGLKIGFNGGYENARIDNNQYAIDLMDRTAGNPNWLVVKPFLTQTSNCVLPTYVVNQDLDLNKTNGVSIAFACIAAYSFGDDPITLSPYIANPSPGALGPYPGFDPLAGNDPSNPYTGQNVYSGVDYGPAPNNGEGFAKNIGGNQMPNAPHFTTSLSADFTMPVSEDWAATLHGDFYYQSGSYWRIFNDSEYDKLHGYTNINMALILTNQDGWQATVYVKNLVDTTAITGAFLNSDDTALTTNVFTTDPRLFGIRVTKNW